MYQPRVLRIWILKEVTSVQTNLWPVEHFCPPFFPDQHWSGADLEKKNGGEKCSTGQRFIYVKVTSYKIHTLIKLIDGKFQISTFRRKKHFKMNKIFISFTWYSRVKVLWQLYASMMSLVRRWVELVFYKNIQCFFILFSENSQILFKISVILIYLLK